MLDTMQLTAIMTDPTPPSAPPEHGGANELLGVVRTDGEFKQRVGWLTGPRRPWDVIRDRLPAREDVPARSLGLVVGSLVLLIGGLVAGTVITSTSATPSNTSQAGLGAVAHRLIMSPSSFELAQASTTPIPAKPLVALSSPTSAHEVFGYAPYWSLPDWQSFPYGDFSTVAYFSVNVNPNGSIQQSGPGWNGYNSEDFVNLINAAHRAGDRVVLTANDFTEASLYTLTHSPNAGVVLGTELLELVQTKGLDGVNLDLEGTGSGDRAGLDHLVGQVDFILHSANPHYQLTMATYASSAGDPNGFYDIPGLAQWVNAFFVMAYDVSMGPTGAQREADGGDAAYVDQYVSEVGASKVILGMPLFGYDEPTRGPELGNKATGAAVPVTYAQAAASGPAYWDAATDTAWTSYQSNGQWHQVFFDNANSLEGKVQLAAKSGLLGVGIWALGMEGNDNSLLNLLRGGVVSLRTPPEGPTTSAAAATIIKRVKIKPRSGNGGVGTSTTTTSLNVDGGGAHHGNGSTTTSTSMITTPSAPATSTTTTSPPTSSTTTTAATGDSGNTGSTTTSTVTHQ
jgi:Glycosyl hydrolases family 18